VNLWITHVYVEIFHALLAFSPILKSKTSCMNRIGARVEV